MTKKDNSGVVQKWNKNSSNRGGRRGSRARGAPRRLCHIQGPGVCAATCKRGPESGEQGPTATVWMPPQVSINYLTQKANV